MIMLKMMEHLKKQVKDGLLEVQENIFQVLKLKLLKKEKQYL